MDPITLSAATLALAMIDDLWGLLGERCDLWNGASDGGPDTLLLVGSRDAAHHAEEDHFKRCQGKIARVEAIEAPELDGWQDLAEPIDVRITAQSQSGSTHIEDGHFFYYTEWDAETLDAFATIKTGYGTKQVPLPSSVRVQVAGYTWPDP